MKTSSLIKSLRARKVIKIAQHTLFLPRACMDILCPPVCPVCKTALDDNNNVLCPQCWSNLQENLQVPACPTCGHNVGEYALINNRCHRCQNRRPIVRQVVRVGDYSGMLRELIIALKFRRQGRLDLFLGTLLGAAMLGSPFIDSIDMLVPVPLHWRRRWSRRYNQAELIARESARYLKRHGKPIPINYDLVRIRNTPPQTSLSPSERLINLRGAFAVRPKSPLYGKHVCLIDDVTTTGTTLRVAARSLKKAGCSNVSAAVLAVAAND